MRKLVDELRQTSWGGFYESVTAEIYGQNLIGVALKFMKSYFVACISNKDGNKSKIL
jgi:hypothetical protein